MPHKNLGIVAGIILLIALTACGQGGQPGFQAAVEAAVSSTIAARPTTTPDIAATLDRAVASTVVAALSASRYAYLPETPATDPCGRDPGYYPKIYNRYEVDRRVQILTLPLPEITEEAIAVREQAAGSMILDVILAPCGVMEHMIGRGFRPYGLGDKAVQAARQITFLPATYQGEQVPQRFSVIYDFYLCEPSSLCVRVSEDTE